LALKRRPIANPTALAEILGLLGEPEFISNQSSTATADWNYGPPIDFGLRFLTQKDFPAASGQAVVAESDAEIDRIGAGREASYAKLAVARTKYASNVPPQIYKSPENGIVLQSSTDKGTLNLIFEGNQAIMVRSTDDFMVQVNCSLNPKSVNELLDMYELELSRITLAAE
jgi:hypothetical protein